MDGGEVRLVLAILPELQANGSGAGAAENGVWRGKSMRQGCKGVICNKKNINMDLQVLFLGFLLLLHCFFVDKNVKIMAWHGGIDLFLFFY